MNRCRLVSYADVGIIINKYEYAVTICRLVSIPLEQSPFFRYECDILIHLLRSQIEMQLWRFLPSLLHLHDAHSKLNSWHTIVQSKEVGDW